MLNFLSFLFKINSVKNKFNIKKCRIKFIEDYKSSTKILTGDFSIKKLNNPLLKTIVGYPSVITSYKNPEHKYNRDIARDCLYDFTPQEITIIREIIREELKVINFKKSFNGNAFCHRLSYRIATRIFIGDIKKHDFKLYKILKGLQLNIPYGIILFMRVFFKHKIFNSHQVLFKKNSVPHLLEVMIKNDSFSKSDRFYRIEKIIESYKEHENLHTHLSGILLAAQETFASSISWLFHELLKSKVQNRLRVSLKKNKYEAQSFIDSVLNKYPPLWLIVRNTSKCNLRKEISIIKVEKINNCPFNNKSLTFGYGHRYCLGAKLAREELFIVLEELINNYQISIKSFSVKKEYSNLLRCHFKTKLWITQV